MNILTMLIALAAGKGGTRIKAEFLGTLLTNILTQQNTATLLPQRIECPLQLWPRVARPEIPRSLLARHGPGMNLMPWDRNKHGWQGRDLFSPPFTKP